MRFRDELVTLFFWLMIIIILYLNVYLYFVSWKWGVTYTVLTIAAVFGLLIAASYGMAKISAEQENYYRY